MIVRRKKLYVEESTHMKKVIYILTVLAKDKIVKKDMRKNYLYIKVREDKS